MGYFRQWHEVRANDIADYVKGYGGIEIVEVAGNDFSESYFAIQKIIKTMRKERRPFLLHADVPLLNHHTSGVRMEWYRDDLEAHQNKDPLPGLKVQLKESEVSPAEIKKIEDESVINVASDFKKAVQADDPDPEELFENVFHPTEVTEEKGDRAPAGASQPLWWTVPCLPSKNSWKIILECLLYGQDVGKRLGGVFRKQQHWLILLVIIEYSIHLFKKPSSLEAPWDCPLHWLQAHCRGTICRLHLAGTQPIVHRS